MLPDYDLYDMPHHEEIAQELRSELFKQNNRLEEAERLLRKIGWVLEQPCWRTYGALATLLNDIDDLLGD